MRALEAAQTAPAEIQPRPLSWTDSDPEGAIKLHEPCAAVVLVQRQHLKWVGPFFKVFFQRL